MANFDDIKQLCKKNKIKIVRDSSPDFAEDSLAAYPHNRFLYVPDNWYGVEEGDDLFELLRYIGWIVVDGESDFEHEKESTLWAIKKAFILDVNISLLKAREIQEELDDISDDS